MFSLLQMLHTFSNCTIEFVKKNLTYSSSNLVENPMIEGRKEINLLFFF